MSKTVNTLNIGDKIYDPRVEIIDEYSITEIQKSEKGIRVGADEYFYSRLRDSDYNAAIATKVSFEGGKRSYFLRIEDAQAIQRRLQIAELKRLQGAAHNSLRVLNEFTLKYFTINQP